MKRSQKANITQFRARNSGFTLVEVILSIAIIGIVMSGVIAGFIQSSRTAEWSAYSLAAQSLAIQRLEQARAAKWDPMGAPSVDLLVQSNFPTLTEILDIPVSGTNVTYATTTTTITNISTDPPLKLISVECVWKFQNRGLFTNSIATYRAPDQ